MMIKLVLLAFVATVVAVNPGIDVTGSLAFSPASATACCPTALVLQNKGRKCNDICFNSDSQRCFRGTAAGSQSDVSGSNAQVCTNGQNVCGYSYCTANDRLSRKAAMNTWSAKNGKCVTDNNDVCYTGSTTGFSTDADLLCPSATKIRCGWSCMNEASQYCIKGDFMTTINDTTVSTEADNLACAKTQKRCGNVCWSRTSKCYQTNSLTENNFDAAGHGTGNADLMCPATFKRCSSARSCLGTMWFNGAPKVIYDRSINMCMSDNNDMCHTAMVSTSGSGDASTSGMPCPANTARCGMECHATTGAQAKTCETVGGLRVALLSTEKICGTEVYTPTTHTCFAGSSVLANGGTTGTKLCVGQNVAAGQDGECACQAVRAVSGCPGTTTQSCGCVSGGSSSSASTVVVSFAAFVAAAFAFFF